MDKKDNLVKNKAQNTEVQHSILVCSTIVALVVSVIWFLSAPHGKWWFAIPGIGTWYWFTSLQEDSISLVKKEDYANNSEKYWDRVQSQLAHCQVTSITIAIVVFMFIFFFLKPQFD